MLKGWAFEPDSLSHLCVCVEMCELVQATQQMEVKALSMTISHWPTWTRLEHLVRTHTHTLSRRLKSATFYIINGTK